MSGTHLRRAALMGLLVPALGLSAVGATDRGRYRAGAASAITDPSGDTVDDNDAPIASPRSDIVSGSAELSGSNYILRYSTAESVDPRRDPNWASDDTFTDFYLDTDGDGEPNFDVEYGLDDGELYVDVFGYGDRDDPAAACTGTAGFEGGSYTATVPASCVGSPAELGYRVETLYDLNGVEEDTSPLAYDNAPDDGYAGPV